MFLTELLFNLPGRIFGGVMPYGHYDPEGDSLLEFRAEGIQVIVLLVEEEECLSNTGRNLLFLYEKEGYDVIHLPIPDLGVPSKENLEQAANLAIERAKAGQNIVIHCHAGIGRTGLFIAYLAKKLFGLSGEDAILWVRRYIPGAVESENRRKFILSSDMEGKRK